MFLTRSPLWRAVTSWRREVPRKSSRIRKKNVHENSYLTITISKRWPEEFSLLNYRHGKRVNSVALFGLRSPIGFLSFVRLRHWCKETAISLSSRERAIARQRQSGRRLLQRHSFKGCVLRESSYSESFRPPRRRTKPLLAVVLRQMYNTRYLNFLEKNSYGS